MIDRLPQVDESDPSKPPPLVMKVDGEKYINATDYDAQELMVRFLRFIAYSTNNLSLEPSPTWLFIELGHQEPVQ